MERSTNVHSELWDPRAHLSVAAIGLVDVGLFVLILVAIFAAWALVRFWLSRHDPGTAEPHSPEYEERLAELERLHAAGVWGDLHSDLQNR